MYSGALNEYEGGAGVRTLVPMVTLKEGVSVLTSCYPDSLVPMQQQPFLLRWYSHSLSDILLLMWSHTALRQTTSPTSHASSRSFYSVYGSPRLTLWSRREFMDTAILIMIIFAISDSNNLPPPPGKMLYPNQSALHSAKRCLLPGAAPLILLFLILGIGACLGWQTA